VGGGHLRPPFTAFKSRHMLLSNDEASEGEAAGRSFYKSSATVDKTVDTTALLGTVGLGAAAPSPPPQAVNRLRLHITGTISKKKPHGQTAFLR